MKVTNSKRLLSLFCAGCIALSSMPNALYASELSNEVLTSEHGIQASSQEAVEKLHPVDTIKKADVTMKYNGNEITFYDDEKDFQDKEDFKRLLNQISSGSSPASINLTAEVNDSDHYRIKETNGKKFEWVKAKNGKGNAFEHWQDLADDESFEPSAYGAYGIKVVLEAKENHEFGNIHQQIHPNIGKINASIKRGNGREIEFIYQFPKSVRKTIGDINFTITKPAEGQKVSEAKKVIKSEPNAPYHVEVLSWKEQNASSALPDTASFEGAKTYEAQIKVTLNPFYDRNAENVADNIATINGDQVQASDAENYHPNDSKSGNVYEKSLKQGTLTFKKEFQTEAFKGITTFTIDPTEFTLNESSETKTLTATINPSDASNQKIIWESKDEKIAKVKGTSATQATVTPVATGDTTLTATIQNAWKENGELKDKVVTITVHVNLPFEVRFKPQEGTIEGLNPNTDKVISLRKGEQISSGEFPTVTRDGYRFKGWFTQENDGESVTADKRYNEATTVYAQWAKQIKITFHADGGLIEGRPTLEKSIDKDAKLAQLPTPARSGFDFVGWHTSKNGGEKVDANKIYNSDINLFARWSKISSYDPDRNSDSGQGSQSKVEKRKDKKAQQTKQEQTKQEQTKQEQTKQEQKKQETEKLPKTPDLSKTAIERVKEFEDVNEKNWFYHSVIKMMEYGIMNGISEHSFAPNQFSSRGMIMTMLYNLADKPAVSNLRHFKDVRSDAYYANPISWASEHKLVNGIAEDMFAPDQEISREQLSVILYHYYLLQNKDQSNEASMELSGFSDFEKVKEYAQPAMRWAVSNKLILGTDKNELNPSAPATRAQTAAIFERFINLIKK